MKILMLNNSKEPLYSQISRQIKNHIHRGELKSDSPLPSIRFLAKELSVSVITVKKAYQELETDKYIYSVPGKGFYVTPYSHQEIIDENFINIKSRLDEIRVEANDVGIKKEKFIEIITDYLKELK